MINARELRIGNWVRHKATWSYRNDIKEPVEFDFQIEMNDFYKDGECTIMLDSDIEPIPLTEEWLIKFGFFRHHKDYANDVIYLKNVVDSKEFEWGCYPNELGSGIQINNRKLLKYVHQLQNLYHALTGTELTLK